MNRDSIRLVAAIALTAWAQAMPAADGGWQCATIGGGTAPALAQSAASYLERAGRIYPSQLLGMVSAGGRVYLLNANDGGWSERVREGLMELRLAEPDITAARRFQVAVSGRTDVEIPAGDYACLARERAGRHGLALSGRGGIHLAPGRSVHLVDPHEGAVVVEVRAVGREPLDFREILALSGRSGIYAGLAGGRTQPEAAASARETAVPVAVAVGPAGHPDGEVIITPRPGDVPPAVEEKMRAVTVAAAPPAPAPVHPAPAASSKVEEPPASQSLKPSPSEARATAVIAAAKPVAVAAPEPSPQPARSPDGQSHDEYAKAMKTLLALRRSGGVRSMSEMTYVHPAVEHLHARR